jgi:hypothetical protein
MPMPLIHFIQCYPFLLSSAAIPISSPRTLLCGRSGRGLASDISGGPGTRPRVELGATLAGAEPPARVGVALPSAYATGLTELFRGRPLLGFPMGGAAGVRLLPLGHHHWDLSWAESSLGYGRHSPVRCLWAEVAAS